MTPEARDKIVVYGLGGLLVVLIGLNAWWFLFHGSGGHDELLDQPAPEVQLPALADAGTFRLSEHRGKVVLLDFWAIYCAPCKRQMPVLQELHQEIPGADLQIISVNTDDPRERDRVQRVSAFIQQGGYTFPVVLDTGRASSDFKVERIPTLIIIDREGNVRYVHTGLAAKAELSREVRRLLEAPASGV